MMAYGLSHMAYGLAVLPAAIERAWRASYTPYAPLAGSSLPGAQALGGGLHGADDPLVAGTAAQDCGQPSARFFLRRRGVGPQQIVSGDEHPRGAEPALQPVVLPESLLERVQPALSG